MTTPAWIATVTALIVSGCVVEDPPDTETDVAASIVQHPGALPYSSVHPQTTTTTTATTATTLDDGGSDDGGDAGPPPARRPLLACATCHPPYPFPESGVPTLPADAGIVCSACHIVIRPNPDPHPTRPPGPNPPSPVPLPGGTNPTYCRICHNDVAPLDGARLSP